MRITGIYAALAVILVIILIVRVSLLRRALRIGIGDGGNQEMMRRIRVHANAIENLPLGLILLLVLELNQTAPIWLHLFGCMLVIGRVAHAVGLSKSAGTSAARAIGALLTWLSMLAMALLLLWQWFLIR